MTLRKSITVEQVKLETGEKAYRVMQIENMCDIGIGDVLSQAILDHYAITKKMAYTVVPCAKCRMPLSIDM